MILPLFIKWLIAITVFFRYPRLVIADSGPSFIVQPPHRLDFSNTKGATLDCVANGFPAPGISWALLDGTSVSNVTNLRFVSPNGSLIFSAFHSEQFRPDVHTVGYRCIASNVFGTIVSRETHVKAVLTVDYDIHVYDEFAIRGNTAVLKCHIPAFLEEYVSVASWIKDDTLKIVASTETDGKFWVSPLGHLFVKTVINSDKGSSYRCQIYNQLTGESKTSSTAGRLIISDPQGNIPPKIVDVVSTLSGYKGSTVFFPCVAQGLPIPTITWLHRSESGEKNIYPSSRIKRISHGLWISNVQESDAGIYVCQVNSSTWIATSEISFLVLVPLQAHMEPSSQILDVGQSLKLNCHITGHPISSVVWFKDGTVVPSTFTQTSKSRSLSTLYISSIKAEDKGMYQCFANNERNITHDVAQVTLGDFLPILQEGFEQHTIEPGASLYLHCLAFGNPHPSIIWTLDSVQVQNHSMTSSITQQMDSKGSIRSVLRMRNVRKEDGGLYTCEVSNRVGQVKHSARVNIHGSLDARPIPPVTAIAGEDTVITCPVYGYPIDNVEWRKGSLLLPTTVRQQVFVNGTLLIKKVQRGVDNGEYLCFATNSKGEMAQSKVQMSVMALPKIIPFSFQDDQNFKGMRAHITCAVSQGDLPIIFLWLKDDKPLLPLLDVKVTSYDQHSSALSIESVTAIHSGNYTCVAKNPAGEASYTAQLLVQVQPKIQPFKFQDDHFSVGGNIAAVCMLTEGDPPIVFSWRKDGVSIESVSGINIVSVRDFSSMLTIINATSNHSGNYSCTASNSAASNSFTAELKVNVAPKIVPFSFGDYYFAGVLARVSCVVYQGDLPLVIQWLKDGQQLLSDSGSRIHEMDDFTSVLTIDSIQSKHSGNYTCIAKNAAAAASHTAQLVVKVPPKIVPFSFQDEQLTEGMFVRISCVISRGDLPLNISWLKDDKPLSSDIGISIRNFDEYSSVLSINSLTSHHNGNYTCLASNAAAPATFTAPLLVNVPPRWMHYPDQVVAAVLKQSVLLHCEADGFPKPKITWMKETEAINNDDSMRSFPNGTLMIYSVEEKQEGYYVCKADNGIGEGLDYIVHLKVYDPPVILDEPETKKVKAGKNAVLSCIAKGDLPLNITWLVDGKVITSPNHGSFIIKNNLATTGLTSELSIKNIKRDDDSSFTCLAQNAFGRDQIEITVLVQSHPDPPADLSVTDVGNQTVRAAWKAPFDGNDKITKYILEFKEIGGTGHNKTLPDDAYVTTVSGLHPSAMYWFRMFAENSLGQSGGTDFVKVQIAGEAPTGVPHSVNVHTLDSQTVKVSWQPPPKDTWNGDIRGYYVGYRPASSTEPYNFQLLEVPAGYDKGLSFTIPELQEFTKYAIVIQAFNDIGKGPLSTEILVMTSEDVPTKPPSDVRCSALSSDKISVFWKPPPVDSINGILRGHRILYWPVNVWDGKRIGMVNSTLSTATVKDLDPFTNYSIQVAGYTLAGDGIPSKPVYCRTWEDVPGAPADIKCVSASTESVAVYWLPPQNMNGHITHYTIYVEDPSDTRQTSYKVLGHSSHFEVQGLKRSLRYKLWVTAASVLGEGRPSSSVYGGASASFVPAKCITFGRLYKVVQGAKVTLPCPAVGVPTPEFIWIHNNEEVPIESRIQLLSKNSLLIDNVQHTDAGNYTCQVKNDFGDDAVSHVVVVQVPPSPPSVNVIMATFNSVGLRWKLRTNGDSPILGYILRFKPEFGSWDSLELQPYQESHTLRNLRCGTAYEISLAAINEVGMGEASDILTVSTDGGAPVAPPVAQLIEESTSHVTLHMDSWVTNGCPILYFTVEYQARKTDGWTLVTKGVKPNQRMQIISDLTPGSWYTLRMTAHSTAGTTVAEYDFATLLEDKAGNFDISDFKEISNVFTVMDYSIIGPIAACGLVVILCLVATCFWVRHRRNQMESENKEGNDARSTLSRLGESNRNTLTSLRQSNIRHTDSDEDISPYAMVRLSDFQHGTSHSAGQTSSAGHSSIGWHQGQVHHHPSAPPMSESYGMGGMYPTGMMMNSSGKAEMAQGQAYAQPQKSGKKLSTGSLPSKFPDQHSQHPETTFVLPPIADGDYDPPPEFKWPFSKQ